MMKVELCNSHVGILTSWNLQLNLPLQSILRLILPSHKSNLKFILRDE